MLRGNYHRNPHLQAAWDKYGEETFEFVILELLDGNENAVRAGEQFWLEHYNRLGSIYNIALEVNNSPTTGKHCSEETKAKIRSGVLAARKRGAYDGHGKKVSAAWARGCYSSAETRRKMYASRPPMPEEQKRKIGEAQKSKWKNGTRDLHYLDDPQYHERLRKVRKGHGALPHPAFVHTETGEIIAAGFNLEEMCKQRELSQSKMWLVQHGRRNHHKGWRMIAEAL